MTKYHKKTDGISESDFLNLNNQIQHLKRENFQLKNLIENLPGDIYWKDKRGVWSGVNKRGADSLRRMGLSQKDNDIIGKTDFELFSLETAAAYRKNDLEVMDKQVEITKEEVNQLPTGETIIQLSTKRPLWDENGFVVGIVGNTIDISYLKKIEEELRQAKEKAELALTAKNKAESATLIAEVKAEQEAEMRKTVMVLVGDIVHDLRTPIATIRTVGNLLGGLLPQIMEVFNEATTLGSQKAERLNKKKLSLIANNSLIDALKSSVVMMDDFINTTLSELSTAQKAHEGELTGDDLTKCSSRRILENTLDAYPIPHDVKIFQEISYDFYLMGNTVLIMKILFNLIKNSLEQIALNGHGDITISTECSGDRNLLKVRDTAGGASPEVMANLFNGYFTTKKNGTGIGLAYCKKTMEIFGGELTCHSVYGDYMEFILSFPKIVEK